jgi:hypothetical protein
MTTHKDECLKGSAMIENELVEKLKPCPFCGGEMVVQGQLFKHVAEPRHGECAIRQNAWALEMVDVWNTRAATEAAAPVTDKCAEMCAKVEADAVSGLRYIERHYGRLEGVGWDRVFNAHDELFARGAALSQQTGA